MIRALYRAARLADGNVLQARVYYPAHYGDSTIERESGLIPADSGFAPMPVVILMPGINVDPSAYAWLARHLAESGFVALTYSLIAEEIPGQISLTPGLSLQALRPEYYGTMPSAYALPGLLALVERLQAEAPLAGLLAVDRVILGGHSAGGSVALLNARRDWFPALRAVFSYAAHSGASTALGWPADSLLPLANDLPLLLLGGECDGVMAASSGRYGDSRAPSTDRVTQTFHQGRFGGDSHTYLAILRGANHFTAAWPHDGCTGRPFLDLPETQPGDALRALMAALISRFCQAYGRGDNDALAELHQLCRTGPGLSIAMMK